MVAEFSKGDGPRHYWLDLDPQLWSFHHRYQYFTIAPAWCGLFPPLARISGGWKAWKNHHATKYGDRSNPIHCQTRPHPNLNWNPLLLLDCHIPTTHDSIASVVPLGLNVIVWQQNGHVVVSHSCIIVSCSCNVVVVVIVSCSCTLIYMTNLYFGILVTHVKEMR